MGFRRLVAVGVTAGVTVLLAGAALSQPPRLPSHAPDLDRTVGVYKERFENGTVQGDSYKSENIFELVKISEKTAYFRIHGEFYNGHTCDLFGVADLEVDALTYHGPPDFHDAPCVLKFTVNKDGVILDDIGGACRNESCGMRGGYGFGDQVDYPFAARRPIRYMARLLKSREYDVAVKEHAAHPVGTPAPAPR